MSKKYVFDQFISSLLNSHQSKKAFNFSTNLFTREFGQIRAKIQKITDQNIELQSFNCYHFYYSNNSNLDETQNGILRYGTVGDLIRSPTLI